MANIVGIGANVYDTLITLPEYPTEDTKMRAKSMKVSGGGPCATGLVAAAKLGADTAYIGNISDDTAGVFLLSDFKKYGVSTELVTGVHGYNSFTSVIWLSEKSVSRTCVFDKGNIPPLMLNTAQKNAIAEAKLLMVDGNELEAAITGAEIARASGTKVLYDAGGLYDGIERLLPLADILIPSEEFALKFTNETDAVSAAKSLYERFHPEVVVITRGKEGGIMFDGKELFAYPAFTVEAVDSNGSGDVFHGAFAFAVTSGMDYCRACLFSSAVSAIKCTKTGAREGAPGYDETIEFLKERKVNV